MELMIHSPKLLMVLLEFVSLSLLLLFCVFIYEQINIFRKLTGHKGIYFLRNSFLFFGLTFIVSFFLLFQRLFNLPFIDMKVSMLLILFLNLVALGYLFFSMFSKQLSKYELYIFLVALLIPIFGGFFRNTFELLFTIQLLLFISFLVMIYYKFKSSTNPNNVMLSIYFFLLIFWLLSGMGIYITRVLEINREVIPILKVFLFGYIWYTIHKRFIK